MNTQSEYFQEIFMGHKSFDVRRADKLFKKGDVLILKEWDSKTVQYTGRQLARNITYISNDQPGIEEGYVVMSIQ